MQRHRPAPLPADTNLSFGTRDGLFTFCPSKDPEVAPHDTLTKGRCDPQARRHTLFPL